MAALPRLQKSTKTLKEKGSQFELAVILPGCAGNNHSARQTAHPRAHPRAHPSPCSGEAPVIRAWLGAPTPSRPAGLNPGFLEFLGFCFLCFEWASPQPKVLGVGEVSRTKRISQSISIFRSVHGFGRFLWVWQPSLSSFV